jgi:hypothetical protein
MAVRIGEANETSKRSVHLAKSFLQSVTVGPFGASEHIGFLINPSVVSVSGSTDKRLLLAALERAIFVADCFLGATSSSSSAAPGVGKIGSRNRVEVGHCHT